MLFKSIISLFLLLTSSLSIVTAFPAASAAFDTAFTAVSNADVNVNVNSHKHDNYDRVLSKFQLDRRALSFDAASQLVSVSGAHSFVPPNFAVGDQRGNCPGLNAMANHGYIPHNGVATVQQFVDGSMNAFSMGSDLATILATLGAVMNGDGTKWSIGGPTPAVPGLLGLLGTPQGIASNASHNKYEGDASGTRGDLYLDGDSAKLSLPLFTQLFDMQPDPATANYDLSVLYPFRAARFQHSLANNPHFFHGPISGIFASTAGTYFIYRMMSNHSSENPEGILNQDVLKSFMAVSGPRSSFTYARGHERIPSNWYRRSPISPYGFNNANLDIAVGGSMYPQFLIPGGNTGAVNTYVPVNVNAVTGGVYTAQTLLQGNNAICFVLGAARFATPDLITGHGGVLTGVLSPLSGALSALNGVLLGALSNLSCPSLATYDQTFFSNFPGSVQGSA